MAVDCGDCSGFVELAQRHLGALISKHGFRSLRCESKRGGRECMWMLESDRCRMLLTLSDGAQDCSLGKLGSPFPPWIAFNLNGELGWCSTLWLIELKARKQILTGKLITRLWEGKLVYFAWLAPMLEKWLPELIAMFEGQAELTWHGDLVQMLERRKPLKPKLPR